MSTKKFPLAHILSITTGRLMCEIGGVYEILNFITGDNLYTHTLPRASKFASPLILELHPELKDTWSPKNAARFDELLDDAKARNEPPSAAIGIWLNWMKQPAQCGLQDEYEIESQESKWEPRNPIEELVEMMGGEERIIPIVI